MNTEQNFKIEILEFRFESERQGAAQLTGRSI